jgi:hypothetical protein
MIHPLSNSRFKRYEPIFKSFPTYLSKYDHAKEYSCRFPEFVYNSSIDSIGWDEIDELFIGKRHKRAHNKCSKHGENYKYKFLFFELYIFPEEEEDFCHILEYMKKIKKTSPFLERFFEKGITWFRK